LQIYWPQRLIVYLNPMHYTISAEMLNQFDEAFLFQVNRGFRREHTPSSVCFNTTM
jgi:hypothetical protein